MKTSFRILLPLLLLLAPPAVVQAQFTFTTNNGTITITGYTGPFFSKAGVQPKELLANEEQLREDYLGYSVVRPIREAIYRTHFEERARLSVPNRQVA
jgi:hypothetical protein